MQRTEIYILCVLYNDTIKNIRSLKNFEKIIENNENIRLVISDNSTKNEIVNYNKNYKLSPGMKYIHNGGNIGLTAAYNIAIGKIRREINKSDQDFFVWFTDDDTWFSEEYLENAIQTVAHENINMISGIVHSNNKVLSPRLRRKYLPFIEKSVYKTGDYKDIYVINSGWMISNKLIEAVGDYNEKLFMDMVDYWMMDMLHKNKLDEIKIVAGEIRQDFSGYEIKNIDSVIKRSEIYIKDLKVYCELTEKSQLYKIVMITRRKFVVAIKKMINKIQN